MRECNPTHPLVSSPVDGSFNLLRAEREELTKEMWEKEKAKERVKVSTEHQTASPVLENVNLVV